MRDRVLALSFDPALETFDDRSLREFLTARNIDAILRHFFVADDAAEILALGLSGSFLPYVLPVGGEVPCGFPDPALASP